MQLVELNKSTYQYGFIDIKSEEKGKIWLTFLIPGCAKGGGRKKRKRKRGGEKKGRKKRRL